MQSISALTFTLLIASALTASTFAASTSWKLDCFPTTGSNKESCEARGCVWSPVKRNKTQNVDPRDKSLYTYLFLMGNHPTKENNFGDLNSRVDEPWCYFPEDYVGYKVIDTTSSDLNATTGAKLVRDKPSGLPDDIGELKVEIREYDSLLRIQIFDAKNSRFQPELPKLKLKEREPNEVLDLEHKLDSNGFLIVKRKSTGAIIFDTDLRKLIFSDKFMQLNSKLNSSMVFGLGEHYGPFLKTTDSYKTYSFWNTDRLPTPGGTRSYGGFPFYVSFDSNRKKAHGLFLHNSNAMDIILQSDQSITFRPIGGILDFLIFDGPKPHDVVAQYQRTVGLPQLPPRWALGFHLCRYNYNNLDKTRLVWQRTREAKIPFDVQWNDIDYMDKHNDFTYDHDKFAGLPEFVKELHDNNMHYVIILDPGVSMEPNYHPFELGSKMDIFVKNASSQVLIGKVWNDSGKTVFPDFSNPKTLDYWKELFVLFHKEIPFDGAWIDMNDISNVVDGSIDGCPQNNNSEMAIYEPGFYKLQTKTLCLSAQHKAGIEYDVHNLYSFYEAIATSYALKATRPNKRPLIISRSSYAGQGHYGGHWNGDLLSTWDYLKWTIPSLIEHSMYGYTLMGSDICGFLGDTTPELCARWSTLGAFYTFARNHNDDKSIDQDPVAMGPEVVEANRNALSKRYSLLPYLYTLMHRAHRYGEPVIRSVPFEFYEKDEPLNIEYQFMWGKALMISPIVQKDTYSKSTFLPWGRWYETDVLPNSDPIDPKRVPRSIISKGQWHESNNISLSNIPIFYRGGHIIPFYPKIELTVPEIVKQPMGLEVVRCKLGLAYGELYLDDGDSLDGEVNHAIMKFDNFTLTISLDHDKYSPTIEFGRVNVYGFNETITRVEVNKEPITHYQVGHLVTFDLNKAQVSKNRDLVIEMKKNA